MCLDPDCPNLYKIKVLEDKIRVLEKSNRNIPLKKEVLNVISSYLLNIDELETTLKNREISYTNKELTILLWELHYSNSITMDSNNKFRIR